jgi:hypothetical protein
VLVGTSATKSLKTAGDFVEKEIESDTPGDTVSPLKKKSLKIIDNAIDSYGSFFTLLLVWLAYLCQSASYTTLFLTSGLFDFDCKGPGFGCTLAETVYSW